MDALNLSDAELTTLSSNQSQQSHRVLVPCSKVGLGILIKGILAFYEGAGGQSAFFQCDLFFYSPVFDVKKNDYQFP